MKKLAFSSLLGLAALGIVAIQPAEALTTAGTVNVNVALYPKCEITQPASTLVLRYVSFQTTESTNTQDFSVKCTTSLPFGVALGTASGTIIGLDYTLNITNAGGTVVTSGTGAGLTAVDFKVKGTLASGQSGECATVQTGTSGSQQDSATGTTGGVGTACTGTAAAHTITVTY